MAQEPKQGVARAEAINLAALSGGAEARPSGPERSRLDDPKVQARPGHKRAAGPARARIAANDDVPSIGGLIYALQQRPSRRPFFLAMVASIGWLLASLLLGGAIIASELQTAPSLAAVLLRPSALAIIATVTIPIGVFWLVAMLIWRSQELRLVSSAMTEVAVRLAEPDKLAEQSVASLSQSVRRQVSSMNDAISRALGRAGELEALVHNEVTALERSYSDNERRIRNLIDELASERHALANNSERVSEALRGLGGEVVREVETATSRITGAVAAAGNAIDARLLERGTAINEQLVRQGAVASDRMLAAGQQLTTILKQTSDRTNELLTDRGNTMIQSLGEMSQRISTDVPELLDRLGEEQVRLITVVEKAGHTLGGLQSALSEQSGQIEAALEERTAHLQNVLDHYSQTVDETFEGRTQSLADRLEKFETGVLETSSALDQSVAEKLTTMTTTLASAEGRISTTLQSAEGRITESISSKSEAFEAALVRHASDLENLFASRSAALDAALIERTKVIDSAFAERTNVFRDTIQSHMELLGNTLEQQAADIDQSLLHGITAVRRTSENITNQSLQTIEGLAHQAHSLREISEGLLRQIYELTSRFENQGQSIMRAAHTLESSNFKIDQVFENRQTELTRMIELMSSRAADFDRFLRTYSDTVETTLSEVEQRTKATVQGLARETSVQSRAAVAELEQVQREFRARAEQVPSEARESANQVRRALQDQLRALDQLSNLARDQVVGRDVAPPLGQSLPALPMPPSGPIKQPMVPQQDLPRPLSPASADRSDTPSPRARQRSVHAAPMPPAGGGQPTVGAMPAGVAPSLPGNGIAGAAGAPPPAGLRPPRRGYTYDPPGGRDVPAHAQNQEAAIREPMRESWSFGDLLARASREDDVPAASAQGQPRRSEPAPSAAPDLDAMAMALSPETNRLVWERLKSGERRVLSRDAYTAQGQRTFDEIVRRLTLEQSFRATAERYLSDFERQMADAAQRDPTGTLERSYRDAETGRVYLLLAHALGRLD